MHFPGFFVFIQEEQECIKSEKLDQDGTMKKLFGLRWYP
jgi:hypothetical protein